MVLDTGQTGSNATDDKRREIFTPNEFARFYGKGRDWVYARIHDGSLPTRQIGERFYLTRADLIATGWLSR
jgi:hypothetical protein